MCSATITNLCDSALYDRFQTPRAEILLFVDLKV